MKILYVITRGTRGGAQTNVRSLARAAREAGHEVTVAIGGKPQWLQEQLKRDGVPMKELISLKRSWNPMVAVRVARELRDIMTNERFELVHAHSTNAIMGLPGVPKDVKRMATIHGLSILDPAWRAPRLYKRAAFEGMRQALKHTDAQLFVSNLDKRRAIETHLIDGSRAHVIHNGLSCPAFQSRKHARMTLGIPERVFCVGTLGRLHDQKQQEVLIDVLACLPELHGRILGSGPNREKLHQRIMKHRMNDRVRIVSDKPDPATFLSAFDLFVLPSRTEGFPYTLLEAAHAMLPVIATNVGGVRELIEHKRTGLLIPRKDVPKLTKSILALHAHPDVRRTLAHALHERVQEQFTERAMCAKTLSLYHELVASTACTPY